ncbi:hypothetical protein BLA3211_01451 [Burkholderia aenigmatica]|uniref:Uncharacterized protein n=1 Tax=Burkholderia aenigmatica TaxID=2015348 RepID=A0A6J5IV77_9BURK|nr:hypothetical protein BLA3211_01451 [Burkholderia aenigmatica]
MFNVIHRMPPFDVLSSFEKREPPIKHPSLAAMKISTHCYQQIAVFEILHPHLQCHGSGIEKGCVVKPRFGE